MKNNLLTEHCDYYIDPQGRLVYKSSFHLQRGTCCFKYCLHCPYGTTLEKFALEFKLQKCNSLIFAYLKDVHCATYSISAKTWNVETHFKEQGLEDELNLKLRTFYKDRDVQ